MTATSRSVELPGGAGLLQHRKVGWEGLTIKRAVIGVHGHGADETQYAQGAMGDQPRNLSDSGYLIAAIAGGGLNPWGSDPAINALTDAYTYLTTTLGCQAKVGLMAWSMGGLAVLNWVKVNKAKVAAVWLWCPALDLDYFHANGSYTAEIDTAYGGNYAVNAVGHKPSAEPASFVGDIPITIAHATDDATVPFSHSQDFVAAVADADVTLRSIGSGGHTGLFSGVPYTEVAEFFARGLW